MGDTQSLRLVAATYPQEKGHPMIDDFPADYVPKAWRPRQDAGDGPFPPRSPGPPAWAPGEDFASMTAKHGRPIGVFEHGREIVYRGGKPGG
jgi:hypothetical protein